jgi:hypothetical protein
MFPFKGNNYYIEYKTKNRREPKSDYQIFNKNFYCHIFFLKINKIIIIGINQYTGLKNSNTKVSM